MQLSLNGRSALFIMRRLRAERTLSKRLSHRIDVMAPDPAPLKRWGKSLFTEEAHPLLGQLHDQQLDIAVPDESLRVRSRNVKNTIYREGISAESFIDVGNGLSISSPELLFVEMAASMHPVEHLMLGHELCGAFSRDAHDPYNGPITYGLPPLTSVARIEAFLRQAKRIRGIHAARTAVSYLNDNAWSPTESLIAALMRLPIDQLGFDMGELTLNPRVPHTKSLPGARESRVPDIVMSGTSVGLNYDGLVHLDLDSVARAGIEMGRRPWLQQTERALRHAVAEARAKAADDIRRNRELAAEGMTVFPLLKEDLYTPGGIEQIMEILIGVLEQRYMRDMRQQRRATTLKTLCQERHRLMLSLLPGIAERDIQVARFINGNKIAEDPQVVAEYWIEL